MARFKIFRKPKFLQKKSKPAPSAAVTESAAAPQKQKRKLFRLPNFLKKKSKQAPAAQAPQAAAPAKKKKFFRKPQFRRTKRVLQKTKSAITRKTRQIVVDKPKGFIVGRWKRFEKTDTFKKYKPRVENSDWFKKVKPIVMKTVKRSDIQKYDAVTEGLERKNADRVFKYTEERFQLLVKEALQEEDPTEKLNALKQAAFHLDNYLKKLLDKKKKTEKKKLGIFKNNTVPGTGEYLKKIKEHLGTMSRLEMDIQKKIDQIVEENVVAIAKDTNYAWTLGSYRTAYIFATAAAKYIRENVPDDVPSTGRHARKDNNGAAPGKGA